MSIYTRWSNKISLGISYIPAAHSVLSNKCIHSHDKNNTLILISVY